MRCVGVRIDTGSQERAYARGAGARDDAAITHSRPVRGRSVEGRGSGGRDLPEQIAIRSDLRKELLYCLAALRREVMKELRPKLIHHTGWRLAVAEHAGEPQYHADRQSPGAQSIDGG